MLINIDIDNIISNNIISDRDNLTIDDSIIQLSKSIKKQGLLHPIVVKENGTEENGTEEYRVICGQRRIIAFKMLGYEKIPAVVKKYNNEKDEILSILDENNKRKKLTSFESFMLYSKILFALSKEDDESLLKNINDNYSLILFLKEITKERLNKLKKRPYDKKYDFFEEQCKELGISSAGIINSKFILDTNPRILELLKQKKATMQIAHMLQLKKDEQYFEELLEYIETSEKITVSDIKEFITKKEEINRKNRKTVVLDKERFLKILETNDAKIISYLNSIAIKLESKIKK